MSGVSAAISTQLRPENGDNAAEGAPYAVGYGIKYEANGLMVSFANTTLKDTLKGSDAIAAAYDVAAFEDDIKEQGAKTKSDVLSVTYAMGDAQLGAGYTRTKWTSGGDWAKQSGYGLFATYAMGNVTPKVAYWKEGDIKDSTDGKIAGSFNVVTLAVDYALSKRTAVGVELQSQSGRKLEVNDGAKSGKKTVTAAYLTHAF